jgi:hypothetical protein
MGDNGGLALVEEVAEDRAAPTGEATKNETTVTAATMTAQRMRARIETSLS